VIAYWFIQQEQGGFPVERAALDGYDLSVLYVDGEWQWLVRCDDRDIAEGAARTAEETHGKKRKPWCSCSIAGSPLPGSSPALTR
jgi:hypothetical protein